MHSPSRYSWPSALKVIVTTADYTAVVFFQCLGMFVALVRAVKEGNLHNCSIG